MTTTDVMYSDIWRWSAQTALPPNNGQVRCDNGAWLDAVTLSVATLSDAGTDASDALRDILAGDGIFLQHKTDPTRWALFETTAPSTAADTYFSIPVTYRDGAGSLPNGGTQIVVELRVPGAEGEGDVANWTMEQIAGHWNSLVTCRHGASRSGVWFRPPLVDDRNFLDQADSAFANHQALFPECDCVPNVAWEPTYLAPEPLLERVVESSPEPVARATSGAAAFIVWGVYPVLYGGRVTCPHGWFQSGVRQGAIGWPNLYEVRDQTYQNHQRIFGCGDALAAADNTASVTLKGLSVARGVMQPIPELSAVVTGSALMWNGSRLSVQQAGQLFEITARFSLARSVAQGAAGYGHLLIQGQSFARAPLSDDNGLATAMVAWSGILPSGYTLRVGYENTSGSYQDVLAGGTLNASTLTVATP